MDTFQTIDRYLQDPEGEADAFWESGAVLWVDWRDYDEWVVEGVCERLPEDARFRFEVRDSALPRGTDILLEQKGTLTAIPYGPDRLDRDSTLKAVEVAIAPAYQLRCFVPSLENDTVGFCLLPTADWQRLEASFGVQTVARQFRPIGPDSCIFG